MMPEYISQLLLLPSRIRFSWRNRKRLATSAALIEVLMKRHTEVERTEWPAFRMVYNIGLFTALADEDLWACSEAVGFARTAWHRRFHAKHLAVMMYETPHDLSQMLGPRFDVCIIDLDLNKPWLDRSHAILAKVEAFRERNKAVLGEIRNNVGAHREQRAVEQVRVFAAIDPSRMLAMAVELSEPLRELMTFVKDLVTYMHNPAVMLMHGAKMADRARTQQVRGDTRRVK